LTARSYFTLGGIAIFAKEYLRKSNQVDVDHLLEVAEAKAFLGMWRSID